ncbi:MAG TPA: hypothetical protein VJ724_05880 [Tahibacter sp.]|nr:hypothetical protein [Tahibacter sp.]
MTLNRYTRADGFWIDNQRNQDIADGYNGDQLTIVSDPHSAGQVTFVYDSNGSNYLGSWATAVGAYEVGTDRIEGDIQIQPAGNGPANPARFLIILDRDRTHDAPNDRIHVYVSLGGGGAPDEGSFTGQGGNKPT